MLSIAVKIFFYILEGSSYFTGVDILKSEIYELLILF